MRECERANKQTLREKTNKQRQTKKKKKKQTNKKKKKTKKQKKKNKTNERTTSFSYLKMTERPSLSNTLVEGWTGHMSV